MNVLLKSNPEEISQLKVASSVFHEEFQLVMTRYSESELIVSHESESSTTVDFEFYLKCSKHPVKGVGELSPFNVSESVLKIKAFENNSAQVWHKFVTRRISQMCAEDIMHKGLLSVSAEHTVGEAVALMNENNTGSTVVTDSKGRLEGIFTERDFLKHGMNPELLKSKVATYMTTSPTTISHDSSVTEIYHKFRGANFRHLPVVSGEKLVGMISMRDLVKYWTKLVEVQRESITMEYEKAMSVIVHDLRSPIYAVKSINELLLSGDELPDEYCANGFPNLVDDSCDSMASLINDLLEISTVKSGKVHLEKSKHNLSGIVDEVVRSFEPSANEKSMQLVTEYKDFNLDLLLDRRRSQQAIQNLISNAIKYSEPGTSIEISTYVNDDQVCISVTDFGQGIKKEELPKVFNELCKISSQPTAGEPSTGLGLSIAKRIIEAHGGSVHVMSEPGVKTTFTYSLPLPHTDTATPKAAA